MVTDGRGCLFLSVSLNSILSCDIWINHVNAIDEILMIRRHSAIPDLGLNVLYGKPM